jgi:hypothetical protein
LVYHKSHLTWTKAKLLWWEANDQAPDLRHAQTPYSLVQMYLDLWGVFCVSCYCERSCPFRAVHTNRCSGPVGMPGDNDHVNFPQFRRISIHELTRSESRWVPSQPPVPQKFRRHHNFARPCFHVASQPGRGVWPRRLHGTACSWHHVHVGVSCHPVGPVGRPDSERQLAGRARVAAHVQNACLRTQRGRVTLIPHNSMMYKQLVHMNHIVPHKSVYFQKGPLLHPLQGTANSLEMSDIFRCRGNVDYHSPETIQLTCFSRSVRGNG